MPLVLALRQETAGIVRAPLTLELTPEQFAELISLGLLIPTRAIRTKRGRTVKTEYRLSHAARVLLTKNPKVHR